MKSLFARLLLWFWSSLLLTVVGYAVINAFSVNSEDRRPPLARFVTFQMREALHAYETGGKQALEAFLDRSHEVFESQGVLTDHLGRDLVTGEDRSDLLKHARSRMLYMMLRERSVIYRGAPDGKYWFFLLIPAARVSNWFFLPEHLYVVAAVVLLCYWFAFHLSAPVRKLQRAVERFGRGDLSARARSRRTDELGDLARTFDRMADRIETLLGAERRLLQDISHELRSPLARLRVAVELAKDSPELSLPRVEKEAERLNVMVGELLNVTRAEGDPGSLEKSPVALRSLLQEVVVDAVTDASARGCTVVFQGGDAAVDGNRELLRRAVQNVVRNAIRFTPQGANVEVSLERTGVGARICVRDYGPGVPEASLGRIFDAFYRVETDRDRSTGGVGLGLSITRRAIELHRGAVHARNADPGLEVVIDLPGRAQNRD